MNRKELLMGAGMGAALAYMLDPAAGARRRALARAKLVRASRKTRVGLGAAARDIRNRTWGMAASTRARFATEDLDDTRLIERVRARLGRVSSHPRAIEVEAIGGRVTLRGPILAREMDAVCAAISAIRGVQSVDNALEPHDTAGDIPSLQGEGRLPGRRFDTHLAPATQALVLAGLAATGTYAARYARHH